MTLLHTDISSLPETARGCVLAIGNFDGLHKGHRALIATAQKIAAEAKAPLGVMTFEPHPRQFFQPDGEPFRLTLLPMKQRLLQGLAVDHLFALPFNAALASLTAEEFIEQILVRDLSAKHIVVGKNFAFGRKRTGTADTLTASKKFGVTVAPLARAADGTPYSSSAVRACLKQADFTTAEKLLGWSWALEAPVVHGDKRGRTLGMPTANQNVPDYVRLPYGVYAVRVSIEDGEWRDGVANFGVRPMFAIPQPIFETFIFDFSSEIYGKNMGVMPVRHLRAERAFASVDALVAQMKEDCIAATAVLKSSSLLSP